MISGRVEVPGVLATVEDFVPVVAMVEVVEVVVVLDDDGLRAVVVNEEEPSEVVSGGLLGDIGEPVVVVNGWVLITVCEGSTDVGVELLPGRLVVGRVVVAVVADVRVADVDVASKELQLEYSV